MDYTGDIYRNDMGAGSSTPLVSPPVQALMRERAGQIGGGDADGGGWLGDTLRSAKSTVSDVLEDVGLKPIARAARDAVVGTAVVSLGEGAKAVQGLNKNVGLGFDRAGEQVAASTQETVELAARTAQRVAAVKMQAAAAEQGVLPTAGGAVGAHDSIMSAISVKLGGCGECVVGAYESMLISQVGGGADENEAEVLKLDDAVMKTYATSASAKVKQQLVSMLKKVAQTMLGRDGANIKDGEVFEVFLKKLPDPEDETGQFKASAKTHEALCTQLAKAINDAFGQTIIPSSEPEVVCRQVMEVLYSLQKGLQTEFLVVFNNVQRHLANLRALSDMMRELVAKAQKNVDSTESGPAQEAAIEALAAAKLVEAETTRQLEMLSANVVGALGMSGSEIDSLLSRREKLYRLVEKLSPITSSSSGFSRVLAAAMQGLANTAQMALAVDRALKKTGMSIKEYVDTKSDGELQAAIDRLVKTGDAAAVRAAGETLRKYHGMRGKLGAARGIETVGAADTYPDNVKVKKNLERQGIVLTSIERSFVAKFDSTFQLFTATMEKLAKKMSVVGQGSAIAATDSLDHFRTALQGIQGITYPNAIQALIGYVVSPASESLRNEFVQSTEAAASAARILAQQPDFASLAGELNELAGTLDALRQSIDAFRVEVRQTFTTPSVSAQGGDDVSTYSVIPPAALAKMERPLQLAMNKSGNLLKTSVERLDYFIELAYVRDDFRQAAQLVGENEEKIGTVNAAAIGKKISDIRLELESQLKTMFEAPPAGASHPAREMFEFLKQLNAAGPMPNIPVLLNVNAANAAETTERLKTATGKMLRNFYLAKVNLYRALESFDAYMRAFSGAVLKHPDALSDLEQLFNPARAARQWYGTRTGAQIASVFECFPAITTEDNNGAPVSSYFCDQPTVLARGQTHYYEFIKKALALADPAGHTAVSRFPGNPYAAIPATKVFSWKWGHDDASKQVREVYSSMIVLKNLVSAFFYIGDKFGDASLRSSSLLTPNQMYDYLLSYLEVSAMTMRMPRGSAKSVHEDYPAGPAGARASARLVHLSEFSNLHRASRDPARANLGPSVLDVGLPNGMSSLPFVRVPAGGVAYTATHTFVGTVAPTGALAPGVTNTWTYDNVAAPHFAQATPNMLPQALAAITVTMSSVFPEIGNMFAETDEYFYRILRGMAAKVMAVMGVHVMLERPDKAIPVDPVRTALGAAESAVGGDAAEVIPEAASLYLYGTFALEFFKDLLGLSNTSAGPGLGAKIALLPDFDGAFAPMLNLMFVEMRHQNARDGVYSDAQVAALIREFNKLYEQHKSAGAQTARAAVYAMVKEINRRMSLLTATDIKRIEDAITVRNGLTADSDPNFNDPAAEDVELLPNEGDTAVRGLPSDNYAQMGSTTPDRAALDRYQLRADDVEIFGSLRRKIDGSVLSDSTGVKSARPDDLRAFLRDIMHDIQEQKDNQKRFELVASVLRSRDYSLGSTSARGIIAFHEVVVAPLTALNALLGYISEFADQALEHDALSFDNDLDDIFLKTPPAAAYNAAGGIPSWLFSEVNALGAVGVLLDQHDIETIVAGMNHRRSAAAKPLIRLNAVKFASGTGNVNGAIPNLKFAYPVYDGLLSAEPDMAAVRALLFPAGGPPLNFPFGGSDLFGAAPQAMGPISCNIEFPQNGITIDNQGQIGGVPAATGMWHLLQGSILANRQNPQHHEHVLYQSLKFVLLNRNSLVSSLVDTVAAFAADNQGLVEVSVSNQQMFINYEKMQKLCYDVLQGTRAALGGFRSVIPDALTKLYAGTGNLDTAVKTDGSLLAAEQLYNKLFVKDERLPEAKSVMEVAVQSVSDNFQHAVRSHTFDIEMGSAFVLSTHRWLLGAAPPAGLLQQLLAALPATSVSLRKKPGRYPYRFLMAALSFYPIRGPGYTFGVTDNWPAGTNPSRHHIASTIMTAAPNNVWRLLGTVRTAAAMATPVRVFKDIVQQRVNVVDNNCTIKETPFLAINQLILDALDAVYDETSEKLPRAIVQAFIDKMGGVISDEKSSFPDLIAPAGAPPVGAPHLRVLMQQLAAARLAVGAAGPPPVKVVENTTQAWVAGHPVLTDFSTRTRISPLAPKASAVLCSSLATVLRNAYYNNDTSGKRVNVWESAEEIPEHIKERARAHLPRIHSALDTVRNKIKFLRGLLDSHLEIKGRAIDGDVLFYNFLPITGWSPDYYTGSAEGLNAPVRGAHFDKSYFEELYRSLDALAATAQLAMSGTLEAIGKPATFFEEFAGSTAVAAQFSGRKTLTFPSMLLLLTVQSDANTGVGGISKTGSANFKFAYGTAALFAGKSPDMALFPGVKNAAVQANSVLPSSAQISEMSLAEYLKAVRYLAEVNLVKRHLCVQSRMLNASLQVAPNDAELDSSAFARTMQEKYDNQGFLSRPAAFMLVLQTARLISTQQLAVQNGVAAPLPATYGSSANLAAQYVSNTIGMIGSFYQPDDGFSVAGVVPGKYKLRNALAQYHLPASQATGTRAAYPLLLAGGAGTESAIVDGNVIEKALGILLSPRQDVLKDIADYCYSTTPITPDRSALWIRTFMALRIVPIQPSILSREIPFATTYNWDYAFNEMLVKLIEKYDAGAADRWRKAVKSSTYPEAGYSVQSPAEALLLSVLDPNNPGITAQDYSQFFVPMLIGDDSLPISRPKLLSDALHNGALMGNTFARDAWPERYHPAGAGPVVVSPQTLQPNLWITRERQIDRAVNALMAELARPTTTGDVMGIFLQWMSPTSHLAGLNSDPNSLVNMTYSPIHSLYTAIGAAAALDTRDAIIKYVLPEIRTKMSKLLRVMMTNPAELAAAFASELGQVAANNEARPFMGVVAAATAAADFGSGPFKNAVQEVVKLMTCSCLIGIVLQKHFRDLGLTNQQAYCAAAIVVSPVDVSVAPALGWELGDRLARLGGVGAYFPMMGARNPQTINLRSPILDQAQGPLLGLQTNLNVDLGGVAPIGIANFSATGWLVNGQPVFGPQSSALAVMTTFADWLDKYRQRFVATRVSYVGPHALMLTNVGGWDNSVVGCNYLTPVDYAALNLVLPRAPDVGFGIVHFRVCDALLETSSQASSPGSLYYAEDPTQSGRTLRDHLQEVPLGPDADIIANAAYARTTTTFIRKLVFLTNLQRMLFHQIQTSANDLGKSRVIRGLTVGDPRLTDFRGNESMKPT